MKRLKSRKSYAEHRLAPSCPAIPGHTSSSNQLRPRLEAEEEEEGEAEEGFAVGRLGLGWLGGSD